MTDLIINLFLISEFWISLWFLVNRRGLFGIKLSLNCCFYFLPVSLVTRPATSVVFAELSCIHPYFPAEIQKITTLCELLWFDYLFPTASIIIESRLFPIFFCVFETHGNPHFRVFLDMWQDRRCHSVESLKIRQWYYVTNFIVKAFLSCLTTTYSRSSLFSIFYFISTSFEIFLLSV